MLSQPLIILHKQVLYKYLLETVKFPSEFLEKTEYLHRGLWKINFLQHYLEWLIVLMLLKSQDVCVCVIYANAVGKHATETIQKTRWVQI